MGLLGEMEFVFLAPVGSRPAREGIFSFGASLFPIQRFYIRHISPVEVPVDVVWKNSGEVFLTSKFPGLILKNVLEELSRKSNINFTEKRTDSENGLSVQIYVHVTSMDWGNESVEDIFSLF